MPSWRICQYSYKRINHLKVRLRRFQAVESENVPEKVYDIIKRDLRKKRIRWDGASRKRLRINVTPDLHLTYSKNGGNLGLVLKMKNIACLSILLTKLVKILIYICLNLCYTVL